jgi:acid stress-induced BolA-like protein IbaG/YrbA
MELIDHITAVLDGAFPKSLVEIEETVPGLKVGGHVVWDGFDGVEQIERQRRLWNTLRAELNADEFVHVGVILTLAPIEVAAWTDAAAA